jgi:hypothetical protein
MVSASPPHAASSSAFWPVASTTAIPGNATLGSHASRHGTMRRTTHTKAAALTPKNTGTASQYGSKPNGATNNRKVGG